MNTATEINQAIIDRRLASAYESSVTSLRNRISKGVYPNLKILLKDIESFKENTKEGASHEGFLQNDPLNNTISDLLEGDLFSKLEEIVTIIETIEIATTPEGESLGLFELNLDIQNNA